MRLREALQNDAEALSALAREVYAEAFGASMHPEDLAAHLETKLSPQKFRTMLGQDTFLVAESETGLIGFVQFGEAVLDTAWLTEPVTLRPGDVYIERLYVRPPMRNRGVGSGLLKAALEHPRLRESRTVFLDVWAENRGARRLYARHGFFKVGELPFYRAATGEKIGVDDIMARRQA